MRKPSLLSESLILDIETSEMDYMTDRMLAIKERGGNPEGIEIEHIGSAICLYSKNMPWPSFNTVKGIRSTDIPYIDDMIRFYQSKGRKIQIEIVPSMVDQGLLEVLSEKGLYHAGFHTSMYMELELGIPEEEHSIEIQPIKCDEFEKYAAVHCEGTGLPPQGIDPVARNNEVLYARPGWTFFMAYVEHKPAAVGVMYIKNGIASLTFAATIPDHRSKGLQQALLRRRLAKAIEEKCRLAVSQCSFLSQSHRNMERTGMKLGYVRTTWTGK
ncbi:GNAT family N-acetyltransferase [Paenibacillus sp. EC2-1]|uniref:GNAT family N-acetyltransferase n=1 Tax=Paenibacillus sp. EC2-1 TaxID=3388665 RepID=UPI003BEF04F3